MAWSVEKFSNLGVFKKALAAFVIGFLSAFAQAPFSILPLLIFGISGLYILLGITRKPLHGFIIGYCFMLGYFGFGLYWIGNALLVEDNPYWWAWPLAVSGLPLMLGIFYAPLTAVFVKKFNPKHLNGFLAFIILLSLSEWGRGNLLTGFPWNLILYSWSFSPEMMQSVSVINPYMLNTLTIFWCALPGFLLISQNTKSVKMIIAVSAILSLSSFYTFGALRLQSAQTTFRDDINFVLVQPNIPQEEKWKAEKVFGNFQKILTLSANVETPSDTNKTATYIVWPETSVSYDIFNHPRGKNMIGSMLSTYPENSYIIAGSLRREEEKDQYFNSIVLIDKSVATLDIYDKNHLVPFGEYMPFDEYTGLSPVVGFKGFETGEGYRITQTPENISYFPLVCYEIIFPGLLTQETAERTDVIINTTNDGWYGISPGPYQHLAQAQFRAVETGIPVIRVANTGFSAVINPYGKIIKNTELYKDQRITSPLPQKTIITYSFISGADTTITIYLLITLLLFLIAKKKHHLQTIIE